ncbi:hypothetical protein JXB37_05055 [candidate division WOR-3 bacterium]|nr:hypothetical protein [candidate division WOR-3 bacterium]
MKRTAVLLVIGLLVAVSSADDSLNVRLVGSCDTPGIAFGIALEGNHAYIGAYSAGLRIINVSNPASPYETGFWASPDHARGVAAAGDYAYVACGYAGLRVINVSNPQAPVEVGACALPDYAWGIALAGDHAIVATEDVGLYVVDVSNPAAPVIAGSCDTPGSAVNVVVAGNHAYVADLSGGLRVIDVSNPQSPIEVGHYVPGQLAYGVACSDTFVYLGAVGSLRVVNVANPAGPFEVGSLARADVAQGIAVSGPIVYLGQGNGGFRVVNAAQPNAPVEVGYYYQTAPNHVVASGDYAWCANSYGLRVFEYYGAGIAEERPTPARLPLPTIIRGVLNLTSDFSVLTSDFVLLDASGRKVLDLAPGPNDVRHLSPGVYFIRSSQELPRRQHATRSSALVRRVLLVR